MISQNIAERPLNITSILNNFKPFIKEVYQKNGRKILKRNRIKRINSEQKKSQKEQKLLTLKEIKPNDF